jgi:hypothetical protein
MRVLNVRALYNVQILNKKRSGGGYGSKQQLMSCKWKNANVQERAASPSHEPVKTGVGGRVAQYSHLYSRGGETEPDSPQPASKTSGAAAEVSPTARCLLESINSRPKLKPVAQAVKETLLAPASSVVERYTSTLSRNTPPLLRRYSNMCFRRLCVLRLLVKSISFYSKVSFRGLLAVQVFSNSNSLLKGFGRGYLKGLYNKQIIKRKQAKTLIFSSGQ